MTADGDDFLLAFHRDHPGVTTRAFARGRAEDGRSSYDILAAETPTGASRVLDLGCGDGYLLERLRARGFRGDQLVGIDMSAPELAAARARPRLADAALICARAQSIPLATGAVSCVLSHLAFMLMSEVEGVVAEIARILTPGGVFATIVGGGPRAGSTFEHFLELFVAAYRAQPRRIPRLGDRRTRTDGGLAELLSPERGFTALAIRDYPIDLDGTIDEVCETLATIYEAAALPASVMSSVLATFTADVAPLVRADGTLPCAMAVRLVTARKAI